MKGILYTSVKFVVKVGLYFYHKRIKIVGLEHIPKDKPVIFLPNHQSALIDVLLIVTDCERKPYFLTRADVFSNSFLKTLFSYFRMIPIYRIRDGRKTLSNNNLIFDKCAKLLASEEALVIFPEANHNLRRKVRPLSKGFVRIILRTLEMYPNLDIQLVPVGVNYKDAAHFPDEVAVHYGKAIAVKRLYHQQTLIEFSTAIKIKIKASLEELTTHIPDELDYDAALRVLENDNPDFLNPKETNEKIKFFSNEKFTVPYKRSKQLQGSWFFGVVFIILNFPVVLLWKLMIKPKVPEDEFMGTFRFATGLVFFPIYMIFLFFFFTSFLNIAMALLCLACFILLNTLLVKSHNF
ncbi:lysophospholipid acyltransferase family protein [Maribacter sp. X9]|uniref:lysophospholipid acyltransferase family protein n=1 Tax=Maribacter sp. X9 TaxID=3402159 RepID=UPI003AF34CBD